MSSIIYGVHGLPFANLSTTNGHWVVSSLGQFTSQAVVKVCVQAAV